MSLLYIIKKIVTKYITYRQYEHGAAIVEFIVSLLFIIPIFLSLPVIAKYVATKHKGIESTRYAVWERTVWSTASQDWKEDENIKGDEKIKQEIDMRFYGSQISGMVNSYKTKNQFLVDYNGDSIVAEKNEQSNITLTSSNTLSPINNEYADKLAYEGFSFRVFQASGGGSRCSSRTDIDKNDGLNLGARTYSIVSLSANVRNILSPGLSGPRSKYFTINNQGAILSNAWAATTETKFKSRVSALVHDDTVKCLAQPANILSVLPVYREGRLSTGLGDSDLSTVIGEN